MKHHLFYFLGENIQNGDHSETQNLSTFSQSSKEVRYNKNLYIHWLKNIVMNVFSFYSRIYLLMDHLKKTRRKNVD